MFNDYLLSEYDYSLYFVRFLWCHFEIYIMAVLQNNRYLRNEEVYFNEYYTYYIYVHMYICIYICTFTHVHIYNMYTNNRILS